MMDTVSSGVRASGRKEIALALNGGEGFTT